jgi:hypothetical protein
MGTPFKTAWGFQGEFGGEKMGYFYLERAQAKKIPEDSDGLQEAICFAVQN